MMKQETIRLTLVATVSFALAWAIKPRIPLPQHTNPAAADSADSRTSKNRTAKKSSAPSTTRLQGYLDKITQAASGNESQIQEVMKDIPTSEIPALLAEWQKRAGFSGVDSTQKEAIKQLIAQWYEQDANGALTWLAAMEPKADREMMLTGVLLVEAGRDWDRALAIAEQFGSREEDGLRMPGEFYEKLGECDAPLVMKILQAFTKGSGKRFGTSINFKDGFDFAAMGQMLTQAKSADASLPYSSFPINFLDAWSERDCSAAWDWMVKNPDMAPFAGWADVFPKISKALGVQAADRALIDAVRDPAEGKVDYRRAWNALSTNANAEQLADFIGQLPGQRWEHLEGMAKIGSNWIDDSFNRFNEVLIEQMTPEDRMALLPKTYAKSRGKAIKNATQVLQKLGHSQAEIDAMLPAKTEGN